MEYLRLILRVVTCYLFYNGRVARGPDPTKKKHMSRELFELNNRVVLLYSPDEHIG